MGLFDRFLNSVKLNDDYDDEDEFFDEDDIEEYEEEKPKPKKRFFRKIEEEDYDEEPAKARRQEKPVQEKPAKQPRVSSPKVTPMRKRSAMPSTMEVCVIKPSSMNETKEIADTLLDNCTVVLNLEGIDVELAQRIIDFVSGACYALDGGLQMVSSYIFILTPSHVTISGDIQDILNGAAPSIRNDI